MSGPADDILSEDWDERPCTFRIEPGVRRGYTVTVLQGLLGYSFSRLTLRGAQRAARRHVAREERRRLRRLAKRQLIEEG